MTVLGSVLHAAGPAVGAGITARVKLIDGADIRATQPRTLAHLLQREAGMSLYDDLGSPAKVTLTSRGFTASPVVGLPQGLSIFLDGVPVNEPDAGQVNFDLLPLDHLQRIEILSGTASLLGAHSLGGAINLLTDAGGARRPGLMDDAELALGSSSRGGLTGQGSMRGNLGSDWGYYAGATHNNEDGWRQLTDATQTLGLLNVSRYGDRQGVRVQAMYAQSVAETAGSLPLSVYRVRPDSNLTAGDFEDLDQLHLAVSGFAAGRAGRFNVIAFARRSDAERFNVNQAADPDVRSFSVNRSLGANADWATNVAAAHGTLGVRAGAGGSTHDARIRIHAERVDPRLTTDVRSPIAKGDAFTTIDYMRGAVGMSVSARYDVTRIPFRNRLNPARDTTSVFQQVSPRLGARLTLPWNAALFASAGRSFRPPALIELACADPNEPCPLPFALGDDPPLAPVVATTVEGGLAWSASRASLSVSAYRSNVRDDIFLFPYDDAGEPAGSTIDGFFANLPRTRREGVELSASVSVGPAQLYANHGWTNATFQVSGVEIFSIREEMGAENAVEVGDRIPLVPRHLLAVGGSTALRGLRVGADARYTGERVMRGDEANDEEPLAGFWVVDGNVGATLRAWSLEVVVRNVFDARHASFGTFNINQGGEGGAVLERFLTPGTPRTVHFLVRRGLRG